MDEIKDAAETERLIRAFCEGARFAWEYFPGALGSKYDAEEVEREARVLARSNELAIAPNTTPCVKKEATN
jgi:hypothetical protein